MVCSTFKAIYALINTIILLHKIAYQPFWLDLTVCISSTYGACSSLRRGCLCYIQTYIPEDNYLFFHTHTQHLDHAQRHLVVFFFEELGSLLFSFIEIESNIFFSRTHFRGSGDHHIGCAH